jgi:cytochrome c oxidase assembly protein subunit 15
VKWLHRYAKLVSASTVLLIAAGGMVTSTGSGLAVPDWPSTYGWFMFSFPIEKMVGGIFYEHGHRLIASAVGFLTTVLALWTWMAESRRWVQRLALAALVAVVLQGLLGGITVLFLLPAPVSIGHAALAQLFFCMTVALTLFTSPSWRAETRAVDDARLQRLALATSLMVYGQILLGATVRHTGAGMAVPDFPLMFGGFLPARWSWPIGLHVAHRLGALAVAVAAAFLAIHVRAHHRSRRELLGPAYLLNLGIVVQISLGAFVIWSGLQPVINTAHVVNGAFVLAMSLVLTLRSFRTRFDRPAQPIEYQRALGSAAVEAHS